MLAVMEKGHVGTGAAVLQLLEPTCSPPVRRQRSTDRKGALTRTMRADASARSSRLQDVRRSLPVVEAPPPWQCDVRVTEDKLVCEKPDQVSRACYLLNWNGDSSSVP